MTGTFQELNPPRRPHPQRCPRRRHQRWQARQPPWPPLRQAVPRRHPAPRLLLLRHRHSHRPRRRHLRPRAHPRQTRPRRLRQRRRHRWWPCRSSAVRRRSLAPSLLFSWEELRLCQLVSWFMQGRVSWFKPTCDTVLLLLVGGGLVFVVFFVFLASDVIFFVFFVFYISIRGRLALLY